MKKFLNSSNFFFLLIFCLSLGQLQRLQITNTIAFYLHDILILFYIVGQFFYAKSSVIKINEKWQKIKKDQKKIFCSIMIISLLATLWQISQNTFNWQAILYALRFFSYLIFIYLAASNSINLKKSFFFFTILILVFGFLQYFFFADLRFLVLSGWDEHYYRLVSTIYDPGFTGLIFVLASIFLSSQKQLTKKMSILNLFFIIALLLTYSRASYLAWLFAIGAQILSQSIFKESTRKSFFIKLLVLSFFLIMLSFLPKASGGEGVNLQRTASVTARLDNNQVHLKRLSATEWLIGRGFFNPSLSSNTNNQLPQHSKFADNNIVFLINNFGLLGSSLILYLLAKEILRLIKNKDNYRLALLTAFLIHSSFNNDFLESFVLLTFLAFYWPGTHQLINKQKILRA